ncbi:OB-fold protein [Clostridium cochlearium]|uniref:OB-fold protein n=1 Tax=Clostridium cochlearium TaxID=1494 RepID=UPI001A9B25C1|nr:hypothetical protein [Clostridium cochlearium]
MQHKVLTVLMIIALVVGISVITEENNGTSKNKPVVIVTSAKLSKEYEENEVKADKQYKNKLASISGEVYDIGVIDGETFSVLSADKDFAVTEVQCFFHDKEEIDKISNLNKGDKVTVEGKIQGK